MLFRGVTMKGCTCSVNKASMTSAEDAVRDLKNWIAVFTTEHKISNDARKQLEARIDELVKKISSISCR
jgi:hypothetical protein